MWLRKPTQHSTRRAEKPGSRVNSALGYFENIMSDQGNPMAPAQVRNAILLFWLSLAVGLLIVILDSNPATKNAPASFVTAVVAITFLIMAFFIYKIKNGRNWARIIFLVFFVIGLVPYVPELMSVFNRSAVIAALSLSQVLMQTIYNKSML